MQVQAYIEQADSKWQEGLSKVIDIFDQHLPEGFQLNIQNGLPTFVVPLETFPAGYHCSPGTALPFVSIAATKNHLAIYHMGIYAHAQLLTWFQEEYPKYMSTKLNMGKSCIRFTNPNKLPFVLLQALAEKVSVQDWLTIYQENIQK